MRLFDVAGPREIRAYCHGPADQPFDPEALVSAGEHDRWNTRGEPTLYLAGDPGVALVELGRHYDPDSSGTDRKLWEVDVLLEQLADLRDAGVRARFGLAGGTDWLHDRRRCREVARAARTSGDVDALIVPSAGLPDQLDRWNLVIFAECLARPVGEVVRDARPVGSVCLRPGAET